MIHLISNFTQLGKEISGVLYPLRAFIDGDTERAIIE